MRWWIASRRPAILVAGLVVSVSGIVAFGSQAVPTPSLVQGFLLSVPLSVYLPLATVVAAILGFSNTPVEIEATAVRRVGLYDAGALASLAALAVGSCALAAALWEGGAPLEGARNIVGYLGLAVLVLSVLGPQPASFVAPGFVVLAATFGLSPSRVARWWAWPLAPADDGRAFAFAIGLFVIGVALLSMRGRHRD